MNIRDVMKISLLTTFNIRACLRNMDKSHKFLHKQTEGIATHYLGYARR